MMYVSQYQLTSAYLTPTPVFYTWSTKKNYFLIKLLALLSVIQLWNRSCTPRISNSIKNRKKRKSIPSLLHTIMARRYLSTPTNNSSTPSYCGHSLNCQQYTVVVTGPEDNLSSISSFPGQVFYDDIRIPTSFKLGLSKPHTASPNLYNRAMQCYILPLCVTLRDLKSLTPTTSRIFSPDRVT